MKQQLADLTGAHIDDEAPDVAEMAHVDGHEEDDDKEE